MALEATPGQSPGLKLFLLLLLFRLRESSQFFGWDELLEAAGAKAFEVERDVAEAEFRSRPHDRRRTPSSHSRGSAASGTSNRASSFSCSRTRMAPRP